MSAVLERPVAPPTGIALPSSFGTNQHIVLWGEWSTYERLLDSLGRDNPGLRITYDRGRLDLMVVSGPHERAKKFLARIVELAAFELRVPIVALGQCTVRRKDLEKGMEPDEWYYVRHAAQMREYRTPDFTKDPPPDLVIEIEETQTFAKRMGICAELGVPEIWRFDGQALRVQVIQPDRSYVDSPTSLSFPMLPMTEISRLCVEAANAVTDEMTLLRHLHDWIQQNLKPQS